MEETLRIKIIELLSRDLNKLYSISEISKKLKSAYSHTNKFVNQLADENIIRMVKVANANICMLNLKESLTLAHVCLVEYSKIKSWAEKRKLLYGKINLFLSRVKKENILIDSLFVDKNEFFIIVPKIDSGIAGLIDKEKPDFDYLLIDREKFSELKNENGEIKNPVIFYGAEKFWELVKQDVKIS